MNERAKERKHEPICRFIFMHGSSDHSDCMDRHMILDTDILRGNSNEITRGNIRFHLIKIITPTTYIVRPTMLKSDDETWNIVNGSNEFMYLDMKMQVFYKNASNLKSLTSLKTGEKCVIERHEKFYRGEILRISTKR